MLPARALADRPRSHRPGNVPPESVEFSWYRGGWGASLRWDTVNGADRYIVKWSHDGHDPQGDLNTRHERAPHSADGWHTVLLLGAHHNSVRINDPGAPITSRFGRGTHLVKVLACHSGWDPANCGTFEPGKLVGYYPTLTINNTDPNPDDSMLHFEIGQVHHTYKYEWKVYASVNPDQVFDDVWISCSDRVHCGWYSMAFRWTCGPSSGR